MRGNKNKFSFKIGSASLNYFNKSINQLQLHEIAFLAALPKAPNNYNPVKNYNSAIDRRNWVIDRMYANGFINKDDLNIPDARILRPRNLVIHDNVKSKLYFIVNVFSDEKIQNLKKKLKNNILKTKSLKND